MSNKKIKKFNDRRLADLSDISGSSKVNNFKTYNELLDAISEVDNNLFKPPELRVLTDHTLTWKKNLNKIKYYFKISFIHFIFIFLFYVFSVQTTTIIANNMSNLAELPQNAEYFKYIILFIFASLSVLPFVVVNNISIRITILQMILMISLGAFMHFNYIFLIWLSYLLYLLTQNLRKLLNIVRS